MSFLEGYKTYIGGAGMILTGLGAFMLQWYNGDPISYEANIALIFTGFSLIGIGDKIERKSP